MHARLRANEGFGMLELLMAIVMLNIGILALVATFNAGAIALQRAGKISTAAVLADTQMEAYRALKYTAIAFDTNSYTTAKADATYTADTAYPGASAAPATVTCAAPLSSHPECLPSQSVTGPDHHRYRIDTYLVYDAPPNGRQGIKVSVVVRDADKLGSSLARESSSFDASTGQ